MIANFPPQTRFFSSSERISLAGIPINTLDQQKCLREEYLAYLRTIVGEFQLTINAYEDVLSIEKTQGSFILKTRSGKGERHYQTKTVILATGGTSRPRSLDVPGEFLPHVSTKMEDPHRYFQQNLLIIGSRNSAVETGLRCYNVGAKVTLAIRREQFDPEHVKYWLLPEVQGRIARGEIKAFFNVSVGEILTDRVMLIPNDEQSPLSIPADFVIKAIGFEADMNLFRQLGIPLSSEHQIPEFNPETMETPVPGVFALGTAVGGTQERYRVFIENCHEHVTKITRTLCERFGKPTGYIPLHLPPKVHGRLEE
jgi:thioredoxin reductase (NADPH)